MLNNIQSHGNIALGRDGVLDELLRLLQAHHLDEAVCLVVGGNLLDL